MRFVLTLLHLLVGLIAVALIAGTAGWAWPAAAQATRIAGWIAAAMLIAGALWRGLSPGPAR